MQYARPRDGGSHAGPTYHPPMADRRCAGAPQPPRRRDQPVPAPARPQPGRLVPVGPRGARPRRASSTGRSSSRSATRPATGATSWSASRSRTRRRRPCLNERFVRDQGRPRGAARPRPDLHGRRPGDDGPGRLADERVPHARRPAVLRRHLLPRHAAPRHAVVPPGARGRARARGRRSGRRSSGGRRGSSTALVEPAGRRRRRRARRRCRAREVLAPAATGDRGRSSTRSTAAGAGRRSSRSR